MNPKLDIVAIGHILKETIRFPNKEEISPVLGSPAAYSSLVMAAQGLTVGIVTYYGDDMQDIIKELDVLDQKGILRNDFTTTNLLIYSEDGTKKVEYLESAPLLRFTSIPDEYFDAEYFKICPMNYEVELSLVEKLYKLEKTVFVDLGGYGGATSDVRHSVNTAYGAGVISRLCKNSSIIKASQEDLASIIPDATPEEAAAYLVREGAKNVVVTLGGNGALYKEGASPITCVDPIKAISEEPDGLLDFTGAGDSFGGGFMVSYVKNQNMHAAVVNGNATASLVIQRSGGCTLSRMPGRSRVSERIKTGK